MLPTTAPKWTLFPIFIPKFLCLGNWSSLGCPPRPWCPPSCPFRLGASNALRLNLSCKSWERGYHDASLRWWWQTLSFWYSFSRSLDPSCSSRIFRRSSSRSRSSSKLDSIQCAEYRPPDEFTYRKSCYSGEQFRYLLTPFMSIDCRNQGRRRKKPPSLTTLSNCFCNCIFLSFRLRTTACWKELIKMLD